MSGGYEEVKDISRNLMTMIGDEKVEWRKLGDVAKIFAGGTPNTARLDFYDGDIPWIRSGEVNFNVITTARRNITEAGLKRSSAKIIRKNSVVLAMTGATVARSAVIEFETAANQSVAAIETDEKIISYKYLYYYLAMNYEKIKNSAQGALTSINLAFIKKIDIPIPTMVVQERVVAVLDRMTDLTAELTAELKLRSKQYSYYREQLLGFAKPIDGGGAGFELEWKKLGEIAKIKTGQLINKNIIAKNPGKYPVINSGIAPLGFIDKFNTENDEIGVTTRGAGVGYVSWNSGKYFRGNLNYSVTIYDKNSVNNRFVYYYLKFAKNKIEQLCTFTGIPALNTSELTKLVVPVPPMAEQKRIVGILDKFDKLTNDISEGLPREIALREKQYEYFREKLFDFAK